MTRLKTDMSVGSIESSLSCFRMLTAEELDFINAHKTQVAYLKGETIFKQGAFSPHVLFVNQGLVRVYLQTGNSRQLNLHLAVSGSFMAFSAVFGENVYQYSAVALTEATICMIEKDALKQLLLQNPRFALQITTRNSSDERRYLEIISNLSYKQMRGKLASALLYLNEEDFAAQQVFHFLSRQDIADFASIPLESTVRFLKEFEKESIISLEGKNINILKKDVLLGISKNG